MTVQAVPRPKRHVRARAARAIVTLPVALFLALAAAATGFVSYLLWPSWPKPKAALDAPSLPVTIAGVLFEVPPGAIRAAVQRYPGPHERIDLVLQWPSLTPPGPQEKAPPPDPENEAEAAASPIADRLFVTIAPLGAVLPPLERLRGIYPHYIESEASAGPDGLAVVPFRAGTPYQGEDLVYLGTAPEQFFARCTRAARGLPGTCMQERAFDAAVMTLRFPRAWLADWRSVASGFDRLAAQLHPPGR